MNVNESRAQRIAGRYTLEALIGEGAMGTVHRGTDHADSCAVAIKVLKPEIAVGNREMVKRFVREGQALRQLNHPNIVGLREAFEDGERHFLVMDYVGGGSLQDLLAREGQLAVPRALQIALDLTDALIRAHRLQIIHRDLKPANVLLEESGTPRLADFGIAHHGDQSMMTQTGMIVGTLAYLSPEALTGEPLDERSDIWSFGTVLFEMLSGRRPFEQETAAAVLTAILNDPPPDIRQYRLDLPEDLVNLLLRMLARDRDDRVPSMRVVGMELEAILHGRPTGAAISPSALDATQEPAVPAGKVKRRPIAPGKIPEPAGRLLGRDDDVEQIIALLAEDPVVTVTGPGGVGKTRMAAAVANRLMDGYPDGVAFVSLAAITEAAEFIPAVAAALDIKEAEKRDLRDGLTELISDREVLLVLDNLEQIVEAAVEVAELVAACPRLRVIATSRMPLRIQAEREYSLSPLPLPEAQERESLPALKACPSVALFLERVRKVNPRFELTADNAADVAEICERLDGLPLALELAAARIRVLSPSALRKRLKRSLDLLTAGARDLPARQRTLRSTIDWSHSLLTEDEQILFRRLSVFAGGFTIDAIAETCHGEDADESLDAFESLVDKGLVRSLDESERFTLLETIREYAFEKLVEAGEEEAIRRRHAHHCLGLAERIHRGTRGDGQLEWMRRGIQEEANLQAALEWLLTLTRAGDADAAETGMRICGELWLYWHIRGKHLTARKWSRSFLDEADDRPPSRGRCLALSTAGVASSTLGQFAVAVEEYDEAIRIARDLDLDDELALATLGMSVNHMSSGDMGAAATYSEETIRLARKLGDDWCLGLALGFHGLLALGGGDPARARQDFDEALSIYRRLEDHEGMGLALSGLAALTASKGEGDEALDRYHESLAAYARIGDRAEEARILDEIAWTYLKLGKARAARDRFLDGIQAFRDVGSLRGVGRVLLGLAATEELAGAPYRAVQIAAAALPLTEEEGVVNAYAEDSPAREYLERAEVALTAEEVQAASNDGRESSVEDVLRMFE